VTPVKKKRKIHIDLSEEIHQKLRVKTALEDVSIQKFVEGLITKAVGRVEVEKLKKKN
jgi:hypothetical protein